MKYLLLIPLIFILTGCINNSETNTIGCGKLGDGSFFVYTNYFEEPTLETCLNAKKEYELKIQCQEENNNCKTLCIDDYRTTAEDCLKRCEIKLDQCL